MKERGNGGLLEEYKWWRMVLRCGGERAGCCVVGVAGDMAMAERVGECWEGGGRGKGIL